MKRFRDCGCDPRDAGTYVQDGTSPLFCPDPDRPCCYVAKFGCSIVVDSVNITGFLGDVFLRVNCAFDTDCKFVSDEANGHNDGSWSLWDDEGPYIRPDLRCTWFARYWGQEFGGGPYALRWTITPGWELDLSNLNDVTLTYDFIGVSYTADETWDKTGPNTLTMTTDHALFPRLPRKVCVVPKAVSDGSGMSIPLCETREPTVDHDLCDDEIPCDYASESDRAACGDDCCPKDVSFDLVCGGESATISGVAEESDVAGVNSPAGISRMLVGNVTFYGVTYNVKFVIYCDGTDWLVDVYVRVDGDTEWNLDATGLVAEFTKCPFAATVTIPPLDTIQCGVETDCCPDDPIPATLTAEIASSCTILNGGTVTLTYNSGAGKWEGAFTTTYEFDVAFWCFEDNWYGSITGVDTPASCSISGSVAVGDCAAPLDVTFDPMSTECMPLDDCTLGQVNSTTMVVTA